jgi:hypothetical protein
VQNSYFLLVQLVKSLKQRIVGYRVVSVFSQEKDELVIEFNNGTVSFFIRAIFHPEFPILIFPDSFGRARKNSVDLFPAIIMNTVVDVKHFENERSILIECSSGYALLFKIHGPSGNVLLVQNDSIQEIFRNTLNIDFDLNIKSIARKIDWSEKFFLDHIDKIRQFYFTFGKEIWRRLYALGYDEAAPEKSWLLIQQVLVELGRGKFCVIRNAQKIEFSLLEENQFESMFDDPIEALNYFYGLKIRDNQFQLKKGSLLKHHEGLCRNLSDHIEKSNNRLSQLNSENQFQLYADLLMANLHQISMGLEKIDLENFYHPGQMVSIRLNPLLTAQKNAEVYYRKSKNREIEIKRLDQILESKLPELAKLQEELSTIRSATEWSQLSSINIKETDASGLKIPQKRLPYQEFLFMGYRILIGKNAADNDELTLKYSFKEDLWLHAKDVSGSHVLIKFKAGQNYPKPVIERAAQIAAYHSKRKGEQLCPVSFTPKKYVRKRKGDPAGAVVVEREEVILVEPKA